MMSPDEAYETIANSQHKQRDLRAFVEKYEEYEATHEKADPGPTRWFEPEDYSVRKVVGSVPFKMKSNGERVDWPGYSSDPPGLYKKVQENKGFHFVVVNTYSNLAFLVGEAGFNDIWEAAEEFGLY